MNKISIIGNLTKDPETRTTPSGSTVCQFTVAVNRRRTQSNPNPEADFFRVNAWNKIGEMCQKYLAKGRKVYVDGSVSVSAYTASDGKPRATMDIYLDNIEFLSPKDDANTSSYTAPAPAQSAPDGYVEVTDDDLPF